MKFLIVLVLFFISVPVSGRNHLLVVEVGEGNSSHLQLEDCSLVSESVNWNVVGDYQAQYFDQIREEYFERRVKVITKQNLDEGIGHYHSIFDVALDDRYRIKDYVYLNQDSYFIVGSVDYYDEIDQTILPQEYGFVQYYHTQQLQWEHVFDEGYSYVSSGVISEVGIIFLLTLEKEHQSDLYVIEMTFNKKIVREQIISGNAYEMGYLLIRFQNTLLITATSNSTAGDIRVSYEHTQFIILIKLDYLSFELIEYHGIGNNRSNHHLDVDVFEGQIYVLMRATGNIGSYPNSSGGYNGYYIITADFNLDKISVRHVPISKMYNGLYVTRNEIVLYDYAFASLSSIDFYHYTHQLTQIKHQRWQYPVQGFHINQVFAIRSEFDDVLIGINVRSQGQVYFGGFVDVVYECFYPYKGKKFNASHIDWARDGEITVLGASDDGVYGVEFVCVRSMTSQVRIYDHQVFLLTAIYANNFPFFEVGIATQSYQQYGLYQHTRFVGSSLVSMALENRFYVRERINISHHQVYDHGLVLEFNGQGFLNDHEIEPGFQINEYGNYRLVVIGNSDERRIIDFSVVDLSLRTIEASEIDFSVSDSYLVSEDFAIVLENKYQNLITNDSDDLMWVIVVCCASVVVVLSLWFKRIKLWRK